MSLRQLGKGIGYTLLGLLLVLIAALAKIEFEVRQKVIPLTEQALTSQLKKAGDRKGVERVLARYNEHPGWAPEDRTLRGRVRPTTGTGFLFEVSLGYCVFLDTQDRITRVEVDRGITGL